MRSCLIMLLLPLAACNARQADQQRAANPATNNAAAVVAAFPKPQQDVVFFRAIRDAGLPCQEIRSALPQPAHGKNQEWLVRCEDRIPHLISIAPNGDAMVTSRIAP